VADCFGKQHKHVLRDIDNLISTSPDLGPSSHFQGGDYIDAKGETKRQFTMTRDGFMLLAMGFTGTEALQWKLLYIEAFNGAVADGAAAARACASRR
jgi:Rha family phage regulatory protein